MRILVVEDDISLNRLICEKLKKTIILLIPAI